MSSAKFYKYSSWGLLVLNIGLISFLIMGHPPKRDGVKNGGAKEAMNLSEEQHELFLGLAQKQKEQITGINIKQEALLKSYFSQIILETEAANSDSLLNRITQLEKDKILATYQHFVDIKSTLNENQQESFKSFSKHVIATLLNKKRRPNQKGK